MTILASPLTEALLRPSADTAAAITRYASNICVGRRLRAGRTSAGISEKELCDRLGIGRSDLAAYEQGAKRVSANLMLRIADLLRVKTGHFFEGYTAEELSDCLAEHPGGASIAETLAPRSPLVR